MAGSQNVTAPMPPPSIPIVDPATGIVSDGWFAWLSTISVRTGGSLGALITDAIMNSGGTLTGPLILAGNPTVALGAATKQYVDDVLITGAALLAWPSGTTIVAGTYELILAWPWAAGTITGLTASAGSGSLTVAVQAAGSPVSGLGSVTVSGASPVTTSAGTNSRSAGDAVSVVLTGLTGSPSNVTLQLNYQHSDP